MADAYSLLQPTVWAEAPESYSYSKLSAFDKCPRKWQLLHSTWGRHDSFPQRPIPKAVEGTIVHDAIDRLFKELGSRGMPAIGTSNFSEALVETNFWESIENEVKKWNTKLWASEDSGSKSLVRTSGGDLANRAVRLFKARYSGEGNGSPWAKITSKAKKESNADPLSTLEAKGLLSEVYLKHPEMSVVGILDLVELHGTDIQIVDFKTGKASPEHIDQLLFYCVLWWRITGRVPASIVVQYPGDRHESSVSEEKILTTEKNILHQIAQVEEELKRQPTKAVTGAHCRYCPVRARCDEGWRACQPQLERNGRTDVELVVTDDPSPNGFLANVGTAKISVVYSAAFGRKFESKFIGGNRLRLLDVYCDTDKASYEIGDYSEIFFLGYSLAR